MVVIKQKPQATANGTKSFITFNTYLTMKFYDLKFDTWYLEDREMNFEECTSLVLNLGYIAPQLQWRHRNVFFYSRQLLS